MMFEFYFTAILGIVCLFIWKFRGNISKPLPREEANFLRIYLLSQKHATEALRFLFDKHVPKSLLTTHLSNCSTFHWRKDERIILFPVSGGQVKSTDFDSSLLYKLIRNTLNHKIAPPTRRWGSTPLSGEKSEADDIERIRNYRNKIAHNTEFKISNKQYQNQWNELSQAVNRLSQETLKTEITALECTPFIGSQKNEIESMKKNISKMKDEMYELQNELFICQDEITEIQDAVIHSRKDIEDINERHIPRHNRKCHLTLLEDWKRNDILFCDETRGYKAAYEEANTHRIVTFIGGPGSGKTATARHIALLFEKLGWEVVPVCKEEEIIRYGNCNFRQVFVLDDILGVFALDMTRFNNIVSSEKSIIRSLSNRKSKLLLTCRKTVYNEAIVLKPFVFEIVVDLESMNNELNEQEKMKIIKTHCSMAGVDKQFYINLSLTNAKIMFPFLSQLFAVNVKYQMLGSVFFTMPFTYLLEELNKLQKTNTAQYASLVLCLVNNRKLSKENLPSKIVKKGIYNSCGLDRGTADRTIFDALSQIEGTYINKIENEYSFIHDSIYEAVACHYGQESLEQILEYMPANFIANKIIVFEDPSYDNLKIKIKASQYLLLAERLYLDLESHQLFDVFMNKSLKYESFLNVFIKLMRKKPYKDFKITFLAPNIGNCQHLIYCQEESEKKKICVYYKELELLTDKKERQLEDKTGRYIIHRIRVISWVVYYGHTRLLQEIVNHVQDNNESTNLVFGSNIEEQARLLLLSVHNGDPGLIELILEYVQKESMSTSSMYMCDDFVRGNHHRTDSPLTAACRSGSLQIVELLIRSGADVDHKLLVYVASGNIYYEMVKYLAEGRTDIQKCLSNFPLISGYVSPLYIAGMNGCSEIAKCLIQNGADVNIIGFCNMTPIFQASTGGYKEIVKILVENGAYVNFCDDHNTSPLFAASEKGHVDIVLYLIKNGGDVNLCTTRGKSPLYASIENGHFDVVQTLVENNARVSSNKQFPFKCALLKGRLEIAIFLLKNGADYKMQSTCGVTPMQIALWKNYSSILQQIITLENRLVPFNGSRYFFQHLVELCEFEVIPHTSSHKNILSKDIEMNYNDCHLYLLSFISTGADDNELKHLIKLGLCSKQDTKRVHLFIEYVINEASVTNRATKIKLLLDLCNSFNVRDHKCVSLLERTRKLFEQKRSVFKETKLRWKNNPIEEFREVPALMLENGRYAFRKKTSSELDVDEYSSIMSLLKQRIRRFSV